MKKLMYLSVSILCLALTLLIGFYLGSQKVEAQIAPIVGFNATEPVGNYFVILSNGDVYLRTAASVGDPQGSTYYFDSPIYYVGNFWDGAQVPLSPESWGGIKGKYKE